MLVVEDGGVSKRRRVWRLGSTGPGKRVINLLSGGISIIHRQDRLRKRDKCLRKTSRRFAYHGNTASVTGLFVALKPLPSGPIAADRVFAR